MKNTTILLMDLAGSDRAKMELCLKEAELITGRYRAFAPNDFDPRNELSPADEAAATIAKIRSGFEKFSISLNAMTLPEALKPAVHSLTTEINALMAKMPPLQAHKAGTDANYAVNALHSAISCCQEAMDSAMKMVGKMSADCTAAMSLKETAVNGLVATGIAAGVDAEVKKLISEGKLFDKVTVDGLVATAKGQGRELALNGLTVLNNRKKKITEDLKLPLPESDAILEGDDAAFNALTATAKTRLDTLATNGLTISRVPDLVRRMIYAADFDLQLKNALDVLKAGVSPGATREWTASGHRLVV